MPEQKKRRSKADRKKLMVRIVAMACALLIAGSALSALFFL